MTRPSLRALRLSASSTLAAVFLSLGLLMCVLVVPSQAFAGQSAGEIYASVRAGAEWSLGQRPYRAPEQGESEWRAVRDSLGLGATTLAWRGRSLSDTVEALLALREAELLEWEAALIAAYVESGDVTITRGQRWLDFLAALPTMESDEVVRGSVARLRLFELSSSLAVLSSRCLAVSDETMRVLEALAALEDSVPGRRYASIYRSAPSLPEGLTGALEGDDAEVAFAGLYALATLFPHRDILSTVLRETGYVPPAQSCAIDAVMLVTDAPFLPAAQWRTHHRALRAQLAEGLLAPRWLWRIGLHQYLLGNHEALEDLATLYDEQAPDDLPGHELFTSLAGLLEGHVDRERAARGYVPYWTPATYRWAIAENLRVAGRHEEAIVLFERTIDDDGDFVAAYLGLASSQLALRRVEAAERTLGALRYVVVPVPVYVFWYEALSDAVVDALGSGGRSPRQELP